MRQGPEQHPAEARGRVALLVGRPGNHGEVVGVAERRGPLVHHADHRVAIAADADFLADRVDAAREEQRLGGGVAEHDDVPAVLDLVVAEEASRHERDEVQFAPVRGRADHRGRLGGLPRERHALDGREWPAATELEADRLDERRIGQRLGVFVGQVRALDEFEEAAPAREALEPQLLHEHRVAAEGADLVLERVAEPLDQRRHRDDGHHADDDTEDRQRRAHLVGAQRVDRDDEDLPEHADANRHVSTPASGLRSGRAWTREWPGRGRRTAPRMP